jgi:flagellin-like protein
LPELSASFVSGVSRQKEETEGRERDRCAQHKGVLSLTALVVLVAFAVALATFALGCRKYVIIEATIFN